MVKLEPGWGILHSCLVLTSCPGFLQGLCVCARVCVFMPTQREDWGGLGNKETEGRLGSIESILGNL